MSQVAACAPRGRPLISMHIDRKVPQVQGKSSEFSWELIEGMGRLVWGYERFWMRRYLPGFPALGTSERGEDWNGLISIPSSSCENGPMYLPLLNAVCIISQKMSDNSSVDCLLRGVKEW